ncbi:hypothetical protein [Falsibacillus pallidus]|uniref:hypothetical protein n=1 Tax=Falsibacillus pallidus TaxID=493781 RepID=UPI003D965F77
MRFISVAIVVIAVILNIGKGHSWLLWIAFLNLILYLIITLTIPNLIAGSAMKRYKAKIEERHEKGASKEEINEMLDKDITITESDQTQVPSWMYLIGMINVVVGIILLVIGICIRF